MRVCRVFIKEQACATTSWHSLAQIPVEEPTCVRGGLQHRPLFLIATPETVLFAMATPPVTVDQVTKVHAPALMLRREVTVSIAGQGG